MTTMRSALPDRLVLESARVEVRPRRSDRARRIILRIDPVDGHAELVMPARVSLAAARRFAEANGAWLAERLAAVPPRIPFIDGARVPLRGVERHVRHRPDERGNVWLEAGEIHVAGRAEHLTRRLTDWLRGQAREDLVPRAHELSARIDRPIRRITVRDQKTRWGSCSPAGDIAFSWRLVLAPPNVLDYVVAHEIAHLVHAHHGPRFWSLVRKLATDVDGPRAWLGRHGGQLVRYG
jgi:predicted metal-dependent hydrolase